MSKACTMLVRNVPGVVSCERPAIFRVLERQSIRWQKITGKQYVEHFACPLCAKDFHDNSRFIVEPIGEPA